MFGGFCGDRKEKNPLTDNAEDCWLYLLVLLHERVSRVMDARQQGCCMIRPKRKTGFDQKTRKTVPKVMIAPPTIVCFLAFSFKITKLKIIVITTLNLSIGATTETLPIASAPK